MGRLVQNASLMFVWLEAQPHSTNSQQMGLARKKKRGPPKSHSPQTIPTHKYICCTPLDTCKEHSVSNNLWLL